MREHFYLSSYGAVWKLSKTKYRQFLRDVKAGREWNLNDYGKLLFDEQINVTDIDAEEASDMLSRLNKREVSNG